MSYLSSVDAAGDKQARNDIYDRVQRLEGLALVQSRLAEAELDLESFMQFVVDELEKLVGAAGVVLELVDGDHMVYKATSAALAEFNGMRIPKEGSLSGLCAVRRELLICQDTQDDPRVNAQACERTGIRSMICAPLAHRGTVSGVLKICSDAPNKFDEQDIHALRLVTSALASEISNQLRHEQTTLRLRQQASSMRALSAEIGERLELEASLRAKEQRLAGIIANAHQAIVTMTGEGMITCWNKQAEVTFGWTEREALGRDLAELIVPPQLRPMHVAGLRRFVEAGEGGLVGKTLEVQALRRDGDSIPIELAINATRVSGGWEFTALLHDISERRRNNAQFENAFNHAPIGMALVSMDGVLLKVNAAFSKIVGYAAEELCGQNFRELTHPADVSLGQAEITDLLSGEIPSFQLEKRYLHKSGRDVWVRLQVSLVEPQDGTPGHLIAQVEDLTSTRETESRFRLMAQNTTDMITTTDLAGRVTFISAACERVLGLDPDRVIGTRALQYVHEDDRARLESEYGSLLSTGAAKPVRWRAQHQSGEWIWLESNIGLLREGGRETVDGYIDVVRDITERKKREDALTLARQRAEEAVKSKSDFVANVSHELRTPLNSIIGFSHLITEAAELSDETRRRVKLIHNAGQALRGVIDNVLDFSKLEAAALELDCQSFDVQDFARSAIGLLEPQAAAKDLQLRVLLCPEVPRWVDGDSGRLRQVVLNLLSNAVKFTREGSVTLCIWATGKGEKRVVRFEVRDTGVGIPDNRVGTLFSRFVQAGPAVASHYGGTGLGLAISRQLIELMGGNMGVTSKIGEGSTFWFEVELPLVREHDQVALDSSTAQKALNLGSKRILVVDDVDLNRDLMLATLARYGANVSLACDGAEALALAHRERFDLILMDCQMPVLDGFEATRAIRTTENSGAEVPIVALTASAQPQHLKRCIAAGMNDHLAKPLDEKQLERVLRKYLQTDVARVSDAGANVRLAEASQKPSLAARFHDRKTGAVTALQAAALAVSIDDAEAEALRNIAHQLAGTAGLFGEHLLGDLAHELECGLETWSVAERSANLRALYQRFAEAAAKGSS
ncbi:PAS domain S-box protein [Sphingomonas psychrotolerans]|uniref:histidine kinase n=1 Tax=Sphingomonas psychrotolerans TaxID=1327635 RepID=A0ABU3N5L7_9SPHN|nr:PAS domain S-box protein [Sphingomonas psychrotolerans]MDT8758791.1 PAS domain S-box protein [Sphingomonas psychrotolerans]